MLPYYIMLIVSFIFASYAQKLRTEGISLAHVCKDKGILKSAKPRFNNRVVDSDAMIFLFVALSGLPFFLIAAFRYNVGTDFNGYLSLQIPEIMEGDYHRVEVLYRWLIQFSAYLLDGRSYQFVFILTHLIILVLVFSAIRRLSWDYRWSVVILFLSGWYNYSLNIMRQCVAVAIFLYALHFIIEKKPVQYFVAITIAFFFHRTAIIFYPIYFLKFFRLKNWLLVAFLAFCYCIKDFVLNGVKRVAVFLGYSKYLYNEFNYQTFQKVMLFLNIAVLVFVLFAFWYFKIEKKDEDMDDASKKIIVQYDNLLINTQAVTVLMCLWSEIIPNSTRMIYSLIAVQFILVPRAIAGIGSVKEPLKKRDKYMRILSKLAILGVYILMFVIMILVRNIGETTDYQSIFSLLW